MGIAERPLKYLANKGARERWNAAHAAHSLGALSGSIPEEVLSHHGMTQFIRRGLIVLDIGVGLGNMAKYLRSRGCIVDALDVADKAEAAVKEHIRRFYLADSINQLPSRQYDLAISQIVAQHQAEDSLREQIKYVVRALKPGGVFSLHMAGASEGGFANDLTGPIPVGMDGAMCRTPEYAIKLARSAAEGCQVVEVGKRMMWPQFKSYWYFLHIIKERERANT